jgi:ribosomal protein S11
VAGEAALERTTKSLSSTMKGKGKSKPAAVNLMSPDALSASRLSREERLSSSQAGDELDADGNDDDRGEGDARNAAEAANDAMERTTKSLSSTMKGKGKSKPAAVNLVSPDAMSASRLSREERLSSSKAAMPLTRPARMKPWSSRPSR